MDKKIKSRAEVEAMIRRLHRLDVKILYHIKGDPEDSAIAINGKLHSSQSVIIGDDDDLDDFIISDIYLLQGKFDGAIPKGSRFAHMYGWGFSIRHMDGEYYVSIYNYRYAIRIFVNGISLSDFINNRVTLYDLI